jgi:hypothetical protein
MMEGSLKSVPEMEFDGKLKDLLPRMTRHARNELFAEVMETDELKKAQPVRAAFCGKAQRVRAH